jgi:hypothetical protein
MTFFAIVIQTGISLGETALFECQIFRPAGPVDNLEKLIKEKTQKLQLHHIGEAKPPGRSP